mgnify:CR=1 FL=1
MNNRIAKVAQTCVVLTQFIFNVQCTYSTHAVLPFYQQIEVALTRFNQLYLFVFLLLI